MDEQRHHGHIDERQDDLEVATEGTAPRGADVNHHATHGTSAAAADAHAPAAATSHEGHEGHGAASAMPAGEHGAHGGHGGHDRHAGHSVAMFRDKFWLSLLLTIPTLVWGHMLPRLLGYAPPAIPGAR